MFLIHDFFDFSQQIRSDDPEGLESSFLTVESYVIKAAIIHAGGGGSASAEDAQCAAISETEFSPFSLSEQNLDPFPNARLLTCAEDRERLRL